MPYIFYAEVQFYKKQQQETHNGPSNGHDVGLQPRCRLCAMDRIRANACYTVLFCDIVPDNLDYDMSCKFPNGWYTAMGHVHHI